MKIVVRNSKLRPVSSLTGLSMTEDEESSTDGSGRESARWWIADSVSVDWSEELREPSTAPTANRRRVGLGAGCGSGPAAQRGLRVWDTWWDIERSHALRHTEGAQRRGETGELTERPEESRRGTVVRAGRPVFSPSVVQTYSPRARAHARYRACRPAHCRQARRRPGSRAALRPIQAQTVPRGRSQALSEPHSTCALPSAGSCCPQRWHRHLPEAPAVPVCGAKGASGGRLISAFSAVLRPHHSAKLLHSGALTARRDQSDPRDPRIASRPETRKLHGGAGA